MNLSEKNQHGLPKEWIKTTIDHISLVILGQSPPSSTYNKEKKGLPFFQGKRDFGNICPITKNWCNAPKKIAEQNDILISIRAPVGSVNLSAEQCCIGRGLAAIRPYNKIDFMYIFYQLHLLENQIQSKGIGTTFKAITGSQLKSVELNIAPLNEQKHIVAKIESIFAQIDAARDRLEKLASQTKSASGSLDTLRSSVLKQAFEGRLVPQDPKDEPADVMLKTLHKYSEKELKFDKERLPMGWVETKLENISTVILGQSPPSSTYNEEGKGVPFFQGKKDFGEFYPTTRVWCDAPKKIAEQNDILISVRAPVGSTNISTETCCIGRGLSAIRTLKITNMLFVFYYLKHLENDISQKGTGTTFKAITGKQLKSIQVFLPPLPEQHRIVTKIESIFVEIDEKQKGTHSGRQGYLVKIIRTISLQLCIDTF